MVPLVRCPTADLVNHALNAGAGGIIMPHIQSKEQADALVRLVRFPPRGDRSIPPNSVLGKQKDMPPGITTWQIYNDNVAVFAQVEDIYGLENVEEIASVPGGRLKPYYLPTSKR
jgi:2-keto-3-deoxy-L-rhamnonate aldolase RhmA